MCFASCRWRRVVCLEIFVCFEEPRWAQGRLREADWAWRWRYYSGGCCTGGGNRRCDGLRGGRRRHDVQRGCSLFGGRRGSTYWLVGTSCGSLFPDSRVSDGECPSWPSRHFVEPFGPQPVSCFTSSDLSPPSRLDDATRRQGWGVSPPHHPGSFCNLAPNRCPRIRPPPRSTPFATGRGTRCQRGLLPHRLPRPTTGQATRCRCPANRTCGGRLMPLCAWRRRDTSRQGDEHHCGSVARRLR